MPSKPKEQPESALPKGIGKPATRALAAAGVTRLDQVTRFSEAELLAIHGVGPKAVGVIKAALETQGKSLASGG
ncbi:DNA-binding protein [Sorangium sp. So ce1014]|uniref:DNA-binding protein n=1 Tax=Sorangium sp. So ce1014 TaxID=3133326 RepID=UPI003F5EC8FA